METALLGLLVISLSLFLTGCTEKVVKYTVDPIFAYSNVGDVGTYNNGAYSSGAMFIWNINTNQLDYIDTLQLKKVEEERTPGNQKISSVKDFSVKGLPEFLDSEQEAQIELKIGAATEFEVNDQVRENYSHILTALS